MARFDPCGRAIPGGFGSAWRGCFSLAVTRLLSSRSIPGSPSITLSVLLRWALLTSGEAVIWLPRDLSLWRCDVLDLTDGVVLLSALPALCLARQPDPLPWLRLFRTIPARVEADKNGKVTAFETKTEKPNLYAVVGIDGAALTQEVIRTLAAGDTISP
jgi:hypothetical protein